jgi:hypothetical protein
VRARGADIQVFSLNGADFVHLRRKIPDVEKFLLPDISRGKRELDAGKNVSIGRNVAEGMSGAAGVAFEIVG